MIDKDWKATIKEEGAENLIKNFIDTDTMLQPKKVMVGMITQMVN